MPTERAAGFTLVEMAVATITVPVLLGAIYMAVNNVNRIQQTARSASTVTDKMRNTLRRISDEIRVSSALGEDANENGKLDAGEDRNGNGRLEADWSVTANSITFNPMLTDGTFSLPITYTLVEGNLVRTIMLNTSEETTSATICRQVSSFSVANATPQITIGLSVFVPRPNGKVDTQSTSMIVIQRN